MIADRYNIQNLRRVLQNPSLALREVQWVLSKAVSPLNNWYFERRYGSGIDVMERDWDNLFILDACRFDVFSEENSIDGELTQVVSQGNYSWPFIKNNFAGRDLSDTIYVTANPHSERLSEDVFYTVESLLDQWDEDIGTVRPDSVVNATIDVFNQHPEKRLIVHFMQPHLPFIGETASRVRSRLDVQGWDKYDHQEEKSKVDGGVNWWEALKSGEISRAETEKAYQESLNLVLEHVQTLVEELDGKSVVTADHGELFGERIAPGMRREYGHPKYLHLPELRLVPWLEIEGCNRRKVRREEPVGFETHDNVIERLHNLGYTHE
jgi:hypothetical protein